MNSLYEILKKYRLNCKKSCFGLYRRLKMIVNLYAICKKYRLNRL